MERRIKGTNHLLSIIVPVYNVKKHLNNSVNSILQQSYQNIELLLIDDGSSDGSSDLCDEYAKKDHRVSVIHQENQGVSVARNTGIGNSNGDLISFADADDLLDLDMYELLIGTLDETDADVSASAYAYERNPDKVQVITNHDCVPKPMIFKGVQIYESITRHEQSIEGQIWNKVWKRTVIGDHRFRTDLSMCEDALFTWEVLKDAKSVGFLDLPLYHYLIWQQSSMRTASLDKNIGALEVFGTLYEDAKHISEKCIAPLGRQELMWIILSFESLIPVFDKERDTYILLKQNLKKYEQYIGALPLYQRVQLKAIMTNFTLGKMVMNMSNVAKKILRK